MKRRALLVAAAVALALIGTFAVYNYAHNANNRAVAGTKSSQVLIAGKQVPAGTSWSEAVKDGYLKTETLPASATPESAVSNLADSGVADSAVATADIASGQIVLREMFGTQSATTGPISLPKGDIAIAVNMSSNADVAGFVQPGSQIAIFSTYQLSSTGGTNVMGAGQYLTKLLLPKVQVTAVSQAAPTSTTGSNGTTTSSGSVLVTVAVSQDEAQQIILAQQAGALYFALLSDSSVTNVDGGVTNTGSTTATPLSAH